MPVSLCLGKKINIKTRVVHMSFPKVGMSVTEFPYVETLLMIVPVKIIW